MYIGKANHNNAEQMPSTKDIESTHIIYSTTIPETYYNWNSTWNVQTAALHKVHHTNTSGTQQSDLRIAYEDATYHHHAVSIRDPNTAWHDRKTKSIFWFERQQRRPRIARHPLGCRVTSALLRLIGRPMPVICLSEMIGWLQAEPGHSSVTRLCSCN